MKRRVTVRAIITQGSTLFAIKHKAYETATTKDFWCLPGGKLEDTESIEDALKREMIEELGVEPIIGNLLYVHQYKTADQEHLEFFFHVTNTEDYQSIQLSQTTHGELEIAKIAFINPTQETILPEFLQTIKLPLPKNQPTKFFSYL